MGFRSFSTAHAPSATLEASAIVPPGNANPKHRTLGLRLSDSDRLRSEDSMFGAPSCRIPNIVALILIFVCNLRVARSSALVSEEVSTWQATHFAEASDFPLYLTMPQASLPSRAADSLGMVWRRWGMGGIGIRDFSTAHVPSSALEASATPSAMACLWGGLGRVHWLRRTSRHDKRRISPSLRPFHCI